jgi:hypothetical protein
MNYFSFISFLFQNMFSKSFTINILYFFVQVQLINATEVRKIKTI